MRGEKCLFPDFPILVFHLVRKTIIGGQSGVTSSEVEVFFSPYAFFFSFVHAFLFSLSRGFHEDLHRRDLERAMRLWKDDDMDLSFGKSLGYTCRVFFLRSRVWI